MASPPCKMTAQLAFKAGGDVFHRIFTINPQHLVRAAPTKILGCNIRHGSFQTVGSVIEWIYYLDGKQRTCLQLIESVDEEKRRVAFKFITGDLLQRYKNFVLAFQVETRAEKDYIIWTVDYELLDAALPHPISVLKFVIELTVEIEAHIFG
ncbi:kirola-like [Andrographis paniculata]|uniref:kirola-like n=1 Tax=Andrographis paniculata TaxID=175694 RepID=UPI0021E851E0|nr:kirola-like [Andrographis paniculata]